MKSKAPVTHTRLAIVMLAVASSQIHSIGYDKDSQKLAIQFNGKTGPGNPYYYDNVPKEVYDQFVVAESKGKFFGERIKDKDGFPCTKYEPEQSDEAEAA